MTQGFSWREEVSRAEAELADVVERKVKAATTAATIVAAIVSVLGLYVFHGAVPDWATGAIGGIVTGALTFVAGWLAKHTPRTPPAPPTAGPPVDPAA
jgi:hypothetical protein